MRYTRLLLLRILPSVSYVARNQVRRQEGHEESDEGVSQGLPCLIRFEPVACPHRTNDAAEDPAYAEDPEKGTFPAVLPELFEIHGSLLTGWGCPLLVVKERSQ